MKPLLLVPHNDDETLFASFLMQKHRPNVVVVYQSVVQEANGIAAGTREAETAAALDVLLYGGAEWVQGSWPDDGSVPDEQLAEWLSTVIFDRFGLAPVIIPAFSPRGHRDHNQLCRVADGVFTDVLARYLTYDYDGPKQRRGVEVEPEPEWILRKLRALACYRSQVLLGPHRFWLEDLREYVTA